MRDARRKQMEAFIARRQAVSMEELCHTFHVSMNTVRADVAFLAQTGAVEKVYGGVRAAQQQQVPLFTQRTGLHPNEKENIARLAEQSIADRDTLYLDAGTTTMHLIDCLDPAKHVTILTGNLYVVHRAYFLPNVELIVLPGTMNRRTNSVHDVSTLEFLGRYHFAKAFMGVSGVSPDGLLNVSSYIEYELKKLALHQCEQAFLLVDGSKFGGSGLMSYGSLTDMTRIFSDQQCPADVRAFCADKGVPLTLTDV